MEYKEAKDKFISTWGALGTQWGINKVMAQIQALLLISPQPLTMEGIMEELGISRGNTSMSLRGLIDWGIVSKVNKPGERKEYFTCEKDVVELSRKIAKERSRREIQPALQMLKEVSSIKRDGSEKVEEFVKKTNELHELAETADTMLHRIVGQDQNWITKTLIKFLK